MKLSGEMLCSIASSLVAPDMVVSPPDCLKNLNGSVPSSWSYLIAVQTRKPRLLLTLERLAEAL